MSIDGRIANQVRFILDATTGRVKGYRNPVTDVDEQMLTADEIVAAQSVVAGNGNSYLRWCIPGRDPSGTLFKDISGHGNDATIEASNSGAFGTDSRMSTTAGANGGIVQTLAASLLDLGTDSFIMSFAMTNEDPAGNEIVAAWGANSSTAPGLYLSHRSSPAGVMKVVAQRGNGTTPAGTDSAVKFSNAGGTQERHAILAYAAPTRSTYLFRDGVLAATDVGLMTGGSAWVSTTITQPARLGAQPGGNAVAGIFRGWQGYVFEDSGLPINIERVAAMLAEAPSVPLWDHEFNFG